MKLTNGEERHFTTGRYICPQKKVEVDLEAEVPRAWVEWPIRVPCQACGKEHLLQYEDVRQLEPIFGRE